MAIDQSTRLKVEAELRLGKKPQELSDKFGIPYVTIRGWAKKIEESQADEDIDALVQVDEAMLHTMAEEIRSSETVSLPEKKKVEKLIDGVVGLQKLEEKSRAVSFSILGNVEKYLAQQELDDKLTIRDMKDAASIVATLHTAIFSKNVTQVNVLNNTNVDTEKRSIFKSSLGA